MDGKERTSIGIGFRIVVTEQNGQKFISLYMINHRPTKLNRHTNILRRCKKTFTVIH